MEYKVICRTNRLDEPMGEIGWSLLKPGQWYTVINLTEVFDSVTKRTVTYLDILELGSSFPEELFTRLDQVRDSKLDKILDNNDLDPLDWCHYSDMPSPKSYMNNKG